MIAPRPLLLAVAASVLAESSVRADILYWNPATTAKAAGSARWGADTAAWSASSSGTTDPIVWTQGSDAYFTLNGGVNTATVDTVTAQLVRTDNGNSKTYLVPGDGPLTLLGGVYNNSGNLIVESDVVLGADQNWYVGGSVSNHGIRISGPYTLRKTGTKTLHHAFPDTSADLSVVEAGYYAYGGGRLATDLTLGETALQWRLDQPAALWLHALEDGTATYTADSLTIGGAARLELYTKAATRIPELHVGSLDRANGGTLYLNPQRTFGTETRFFVDSAPAQIGSIVEPWLVNVSNRTYLRWADGELLNADLTPYTDEWDSTKDMNVTKAYTLPGDAAANSVRVANGLTVPAGTTLSLASGGLLLYGNSVSGDGTIGAGSREFIVFTADSRQINPTLAGTGGFTVFGGGNLTVLRPAYSGTTRINQGKLTLNSGDDFVLAGPVLGPGELVKAGSGALVFDGNDSTFGKFTPSAGSVLVRDSTVTVSNGVTFGSSAMRFAVTNSTFVFAQGPITTGSGHSDVAMEFISTTGTARGTVIDGSRYGVTVGEGAGAFGNALLVDGGGVTGGTLVTNMIYNTKGLTVGNGVGASNNVVRLQRGAEVWDEITVSNVGNNVGQGVDASGNRLEVLGGEGYTTFLYRGWPGIIGYGSNCCNSVVIDGCGVPGSAFFKGTASTLSVGHSGSLCNSLVITNGGVFAGPAIRIGNNSDSNTVFVVGEGSVLRGSDGSSCLNIGAGENNGFHSEGNLLVVADGGLLERQQKWATVIGGHENNGVKGTSIRNGMVVRNGGTVVTANANYVGRMKGDGYASLSNFVYVVGAGSLWNPGSDRTIVVGVAAEGAVVEGNELVVEDGGRVFARNIYTARESGITDGTHVRDNVVVARSGGTVAAHVEIAAGLANDTNETFTVATGNAFIAEQGGVLETQTFRTENGAGEGNVIVARDGGALQFTVVEPVVSPARPGDIAVENGVVSFRVDRCNVYQLENSTKANGIKNVALSGANGFRLAACTNTASATQAYVFENRGDPKHFVRLEMVGGSTCYRGLATDTLAIGATGSMLCSNTTATVALPFTLDGSLKLYRSALSLQGEAALNGNIEIDLDALPESGAPLTLGASASIGPDATLTLTGTPVEGAVVLASEKAVDFDVEGLVGRWALQRGVRGSGLYSLEKVRTMILFR